MEQNDIFNKYLYMPHKKRQVRIKNLLVFLSVVFFIVSISLSANMKVLAKGDDPQEQTIRDYLAEFEAIRYARGKGIVSNEINAIVQTPDGYIWVGTYSGLYRFNGIRFEDITIDERICNVMALYVDSVGRLWIGTNDSGVFCYDINSEKIEGITSNEGLGADAIRSICEDKKGNIYVGTVSYLSVISKDMKIKTLDEYENIVSVRSMTCMGDDLVTGVTNGGTLFFVEGDKLVLEHEFDQEGVTYTTVAAKDSETVILGTTGDFLEKCSFKDKKLKRIKTIDMEGINFYNKLLQEPEGNGFFFCAENGLGFVDLDGNLTVLNKDGFDSSMTDCILDYQGNVWFASNKQGIMEITKNSFFNVFVKAGLDGNVVNSVFEYNGLLYIGMDSGLEILDAKTYEKKDYEYTKYYDGVRVRHQMLDSHANLWMSTYGKAGLQRVDPEGNAYSFNESTGALGGRFRYSMELSDGQILAASNLGLNFIKGDKVVATLGQDDGMKAPQILTMVEDNGRVLAGSDGDGIYVIEDGKIVDHIGSDEGLLTQVVLRIVPYKNGFFYVTSNAIYYDDRNTIKKLSLFPNTNCYDIYVTPEGMAWVSCNAGIFIADADKMIENIGYAIDLLDYTRGFTTSLTANAWNCLTGDDGDLLLCCTDGVRRISTKNYDAFDTDYNIGVCSLTADEEPVKKNGKGVYEIPAGTRRVEIEISILNYMLSNPIVKFYLEGAKDEGTTLYQDELKPLDYTNLPYGNYKLHIQILAKNTLEVIRDEQYPIYKKPLFYELISVKIFFFMLVAFLVGLLVWWFLRTTVIRRQYEEIRVAKEEADRASSAKSRFLANMSHEIRTPINTIIGMDEMILREDKGLTMKQYSGAVVNYAKSIKRASETLLSLINDILDLSKIESGKMNLVEKDYDLSELLKTITTMIRVRSNEKDLLFETKIDPMIPRYLYGDDGKIKQVLMNLLTNAVKYTAEGSFVLGMKLVSKEGDSCVIDYYVSDTGMGIKSEDMDKLFTAFDRFDEKKNSGILGTGLGLNLSHQFVELMGDELKCNSTYGEGSEFYFTLIQKIVKDEPIGEFFEDDEDSEDEVYVPEFIAPNARILVVDDNEMNLQVITGLLKGTRLCVDTVLSGRECLKKLATEHYELVLLDHMMPEMDGIETLRRIREEGYELPVFALTANAAHNGESYYAKKGFDGYLEKPVNIKKLEETLKNNIPKELLMEVDPDEYLKEKKAEEENEDTDVMDWLFEVEELNVPLGIKNCGGTKAFLDALTTFYYTLDEKSDEIENSYKNEDYELYTIKVHALKSSARIIGASKLSELSATMEEAGKCGNIDKIKENTDNLLTLYREFKEKLKNLEAAEAKADRQKCDEATLREAYEALKEFAPVMDLDSFEMVLLEMKEYDCGDEHNDRFERLFRRMKELDWDSIKAILEEV